MTPIVRTDSLLITLEQVSSVRTSESDPHRLLTASSGSNPWPAQPSPLRETLIGASRLGICENLTALRL